MVESTEADKAFALRFTDVFLAAGSVVVPLISLLTRASRSPPVESLSSLGVGANGLLVPMSSAGKGAAAKGLPPLKSSSTCAALANGLAVTLDILDMASLLAALINRSVVLSAGNETSDSVGTVCVVGSDVPTGRKGAAVDLVASGPNGLFESTSAAIGRVGKAAWKSTAGESKWSNKTRRDTLSIGTHMESINLSRRVRLMFGQHH